jgi:hypothetical protein
MIERNNYEQGTHLILEQSRHFYKQKIINIQKHRQIIKVDLTLLIININNKHKQH